MLSNSNLSCGTLVRKVMAGWLLAAFCFLAFSVAVPQMDSGLQAAAVAGPVALQGDEAAVADEAAAGDGAKKPVEEKNLLAWLWDALGIYLWVFLLLSIALVSLLVMNFLAVRRAVVCPQPLVEGFEAHLDEKQYQEAYELAKADESFLGNVLSAGLAKVSSSYRHAVSAMEEVGAEENMKLDHRSSYLALIGTLAPMIGLLGTVHGMIKAFYTIAVAGTTPDANKLAEGISTALLTTLIGLLIAIPAIAAYNIFKNQIQKLVLDVGITSENLMGRFEKVGSKSK